MNMDGLGEENYVRISEKIRELQAENATLKAKLEQEAQQYEDLRQDYDETLTELERLMLRLQAELAAAQKDAARYLWLRDHDNDLWITMIEAIKVGGEAMEAAIDAAMEAK